MQWGRQQVPFWLLCQLPWKVKGHQPPGGLLLTPVSAFSSHTETSDSMGRLCQAMATQSEAARAFNDCCPVVSLTFLVCGPKMI